jgi:CubicO group peptidase (beta-lactamase class C family)
VPDSLRALNSTGRWTEAVALGTAYLGSVHVGSPQERCRVRASVLASETRLGDVHAARATLKAFDHECRDLPSVAELREVDELRRALSVAGTGTLEPGSESGGMSPSFRTTATAQDAFWQHGDPAALGLNVAALDRHRELCEQTGADACLVVYRSQIVQEWYGPRYAPPMTAMSTTKSITGLLVGMLIADGKIRSLDQPVCDFLPTWCGGVRGRVTLRHLLTMTSGLPAMPDSSVGFADHKNAYVLRLTPTAEPGTRWVYSNEGVQLLAPVLDRAAGEPIQDYARRRLFEPLGMSGTRLHVGDEAWTYADMETTPRDLARVGILMLQDGRWAGAGQIVPAAWVVASTRPSQTLNRRYGLLWWIDPDAGAFAGHGHLDTNLHVLPGADLVVVRMQTKPVSGVREGRYEALALPLLSQIVLVPAR